MRLKVVNDSLAGAMAQVWIDDKQVEDCTAVTVRFGVNEFTEAKISRMVDHLEIDAEAVAQTESETPRKTGPKKLGDVVVKVRPELDLSFMDNASDEMLGALADKLYPLLIDRMVQAQRNQGYIARLDQVAR